MSHRREEQKINSSLNKRLHQKYGQTYFILPGYVPDIEKKKNQYMSSSKLTECVEKIYNTG